jgi:hypothetical protein
MSKRTKLKKKKQQKKRFPWVYLIIVVALLVGTVSVFANKSNNNVASGGAPAIAVDQQNIDMGYIKLGQYRTIKIKVTNTGDGVLQFKETPYIEVLKGCCPPDMTIGSMTLNPGQSTYVQTPEFMMHQGMDGKHDFAIHLKTNDPANPDYLVHVLSDWGP